MKVIMAVIDLYSKRTKNSNDSSDIYQYDSISDTLKAQIAYIWDDMLGNRDDFQSKNRLPGNTHNSYMIYKDIVTSLRREYGLRSALSGRTLILSEYYNDLHSYFSEENNIEKILDVIDLIFRVICYTHENASNAIDELNERFRENNVGYQFINEEIIRVDSQHLHSEVVKPALLLLSEDEYKGAQDEYLKAYEHYRHKKYKEAISEALKSFESVMKVIAQKRKWELPSNSTANVLIDRCFENQLIPQYLSTQFNNIKGLLQSGISTIRNNSSAAHGQGEGIIDVPEYLVSYALHITAANIVLLTEADKSQSA